MGDKVSRRKELSNINLCSILKLERIVSNVTMALKVHCKKVYHKIREDSVQKVTMTLKVYRKKEKKVANVFLSAAI